MTEENNVRILKEAFQLWNESKGESVDHWISLMADDVQARSLADGAPGLEFTQACKGKENVARYFAGLSQDWEMIHYTVDEFIAQGDRVVALGSCEWRNKTTGKVLETPKADFIRMRDSMIVEFFEFYDTAKALAATQ